MLLSNIIFLFVTSYCFLKAFKSIVTYRSNSVVDYVIAITYVFNCMPILFDLCIGIPEYFTWFESIEIAMHHEITCIIYNVYIALSFLILLLYKKKRDKRWHEYNSKLNYIIQHTKQSNILSYIIIPLPFIYAVSQYGISMFLQYTSLEQRGVEDSLFINFLLMLSSFFAITNFLKLPKKKFFHILILFVYLFLVIYLNGKRYIIVTLLIMLLYYYEQRSHGINKRINLKLIYSLIAIGIVLFSFFYFATVRFGHAANENMYAMLRIDFGRDDVTKFVIYREFIENKPILNYPGESVLSTLFAWIPREIWPSKPYPHFRYLTAAILNVDIKDEFAGMTPSIYEMSIANFGFIGIFLTPFILLYLCKFADKSNYLESKLLYLLIIINLLTQAIDASLAFILLLILYSIYNKIFKRYKHYAF